MSDANGSKWEPKFGVRNGGTPPAPAIAPKLTQLIDAARSVSDRAMARLDAWTNQVTGLGTSRDKTTYGYILPSRFLTDDELSALYHSDDMAARMVDVIPQEMLREPFAVETGDPELDALVADKMEDLSVREKIADAIRWARCYGGAGLLIGADDGRDAIEELRPERADDIGYLYVIDRRYLWPISYYDEPGHPKLGKPRTFMVTTTGGTVLNTSVIHESRLILFEGAPTGVREKALYHGWNLSVLQRAYDVLRQFNTGWQAVEQMMTDGSQAVFKVAGLTDMLAAKGGRSALELRMQALDMYRSVARALVIDAGAGEEFERKTASFSEIPQTLDKFMLRLAAAVQIPVTILMGQSPAGMNATGESDFRWFYDRVRAEQNTMLAPRIRKLVHVWLESKVGRQAAKNREPKQLIVKFAPLWTETPLAQAQRISAMATTDAANINAQVFTPEETALQRGRPDGYDGPIVLSEESLKMREDALAAAMLGEDEEPSAEPNAEQQDEEKPKDLFGAPADEDGEPDGSLFRVDALRPFELHRDVDETGVSGTGIVAEGCVFSDGRVAMRWRTATAATTMFDNIGDALKVHGHGGLTRVVYVDEKKP